MSDPYASAAGNGATATSNPDATPFGAPGEDPHDPFPDGVSRRRANPFARRSAAMRQVLMDAVTAVDVLEITRKMVEKAREGNVSAARLVLSYVVGKPQPAEDPDRLDENEWRQFTRETVKAGEMESVIGGMSTTTACTIAGAGVPALQAAAGQSIRETLLAMNEIDEKPQEEDPIEEEQFPPPTTPSAQSPPSKTAEEGNGRKATPAANPPRPPAPGVEETAAKVVGMLLGGLGIPMEATRRAANPKMNRPPDRRADQ